MSLGLVALAALSPACGRGSTSAGDPALAAIQSRIPPLTTTEIGVAPGFLGGGFVYVALRPGKVQRWLQALPLAPELVRDVARLGNELGFDPRVDDVSARLGVDPDGLISMTLMRPLTAQVPAVRAALQRGDTLPNPFPAAGATPSDIAPGPFENPRPRPIPPPAPPAPIPPPDPFPAATAGDIAPPYDRLEPPPVAPQIEPFVPSTPPPDFPSKPSVNQDTLARQAGALGFHSRVYIPVRDPALLLAPIRRAAGKEISRPETAAVCSQLGATDICTGESDFLLVIRSAEGAVAVDVFNFASGSGAAYDAERTAVIVDAMKNAAISELPALATLRGDAVAYVDADQLPAFHEVIALGEAVRRMSWSSDSVRDSLDELAAVTQLRETRRLFSGVRLEIAAEAETLQATFQWEPRDDAAKETFTRIMSRTPAAASVPTLAGLCDGGLACMRTAGIPRLAGFEELATGAYARPSRDFGRIINDGDEWGALELFLETWPNAIGAAQRWPKEEGGRMEVAMIGQGLEAAGRIEGMGGSLRSIHTQGRNTTGDYVGYARVQAGELALLRTMLGFAGVRFNAINLPTIPGKVEQAGLPDDDVPGSLLLVTDPDKVRVGDQDVEVGWATVVDSTDRLSWLLTLPRDMTPSPAFYLELPDLWRLVSSIEDGARELNFAQGWLSGRSVKLAADVVDGRLRFDFQLARESVATQPAK